MSKKPSHVTVTLKRVIILDNGKPRTGGAGGIGAFHISGTKLRDLQAPTLDLPAIGRNPHSVLSIKCFKMTTVGGSRDVLTFSLNEFLEV
jgi:hypothetical protein